MRVALYARVSTIGKGQDVELQLREMRDICERKQISERKEYVDVGVSGAKDVRPALARLMQDAARREFDAVMVWKLDRFGRSLRHLVNSLAELEHHGITFMSVRDNLDLGTPTGRLMFQIIGAMAEFERALIVERVKAGMAHAKAKGQKIGRPISDVDASKVASLRARGASWKTVANVLKVPASTARRACQKAAAGDSR